MKKYLLILALLPALIGACDRIKKPTIAESSAGFERLYQPAYASSFYIEQQGDEKWLHVFNPWQGAENTEMRYCLQLRETFADTLPVHYIPIPVRRAVCLSTTHIAFIDYLGQTSTIVGVSGAGYVSNPQVRERVASGLAHDVGYEDLLSYETIVALQPDVLFAYGVNGEMKAVTDKLNDMGVRVVYLADYLEENALGKAEYMVAVAAFYCLEHEAAGAFEQIAEAYETLAGQGRAAAVRPHVIMNAPWRDTWYMPGEDNYMTRLLLDAGAQPIGVRGGRDSKPVSLEAAYAYALQADYWLHPNALRSLQELREVDNRFVRVPAIINRKVYNNTRRSTPGGGSDFWESGVVHPQVILQDLQHLFHPEWSPAGYDPVYYEPLQ
ncbi:MAG: ABC transporter substrate-binding protein [Prevotellaceae bacterium]|jgi:iron complex transport system substrate-binding protein|nr:ABC transporter substrate-binding protein [Prevotellaceae bacterium]